MGRGQRRVCINGEKEERKKWGGSEHPCRVGKESKEGLGLLEEQKRLWEAIPLR